MRLLRTLSRYAGVLLDQLLPPCCLVCRRSIREGYPPLCSHCVPQASLSSDGACCEVCGEEVEHRTRARCLPCTLVPLGVRMVRSLWPYQGAAEHLIKTYKYGGERGLAPVLADLAAEALLEPGCAAQKSVPHWDLLVCVPSPPATLRRRGFSHLNLVALRLERKLRLPFAPSALDCREARPAQAGLSLTERWKNVSSSFVAAPHYVCGRRVLLLDDVLTSGASIHTAARALREARAGEIDAFTFTRSPRFQRNRIIAALHHAGGGTPHSAYDFAENCPSE